MGDMVTITGNVGNDPQHLTTRGGVSITRFTVASTHRSFDKASGTWSDKDTNWYRVSAFRQLGTNVARSIQKGQRVIVTGRLRIRDWESGEKTGTAVEIDAESIGHDLNWGHTTFTRNVSAAASETPSSAVESAESADGGDGVQAEDEPAEDDLVASGATPF